VKHPSVERNSDPWHGQTKCFLPSSNAYEQPRCGQVIANARTFPGRGSESRRTSDRRRDFLTPSAIVNAVRPANRSAPLLFSQV